jgi:hypothetical protein
MTERRLGALARRSAPITLARPGQGRPEATGAAAGGCPARRKHSAVLRLLRGEDWSWYRRR